MDRKEFQMTENANTEDELTAEDFEVQEPSWWKKNRLGLGILGLILLCSCCCAGWFASQNWDWIQDQVSTIGSGDSVFVDGDSVLEDGYATAGEHDTYFVRKFATDRGFTIAHMMFPDTGNGTISELGDIPNLGEGAQFLVMFQCDAEKAGDCDPWGLDVASAGSYIASYSSAQHAGLSFGSKNGMVLFFPDGDAMAFVEQWNAERANPQIFGPTQ